MNNKKRKNWYLFFENWEKFWKKIGITLFNVLLKRTTMYFSRKK